MIKSETQSEYFCFAWNYNVENVEREVRAQEFLPSIYMSKSAKEHKAI